MTSTTDLPPPYLGSLAVPPPPGVKLACASCIRGHRTSSCTHKDGSKGPLYPIRSKGRPPTQCDFCRQKRKQSGRHTRCDCAARPAPHSANSTAFVALAHSPPRSKKRKTGSVAEQGSESAELRRISGIDQRSASLDGSMGGSILDAAFDSSPTLLPPLSRTSSDGLVPGAADWSTIPPLMMVDLQADWTAKAPFRPLEMPSRSPRSSNSLSLSNLMNPCRQSSDAAPPAASSSSTASRASSPMSPRTPGCRTGPLPSAASPAAPSIELLLQAVDMSSEFVPPRCGCGANCRCPSCQGNEAGPQQLERSSASAAGLSGTQDGQGPRPTSPSRAAAGTAADSSQLDGATEVDCDNCMACDLTLSKPSGINVVDQWLEQEKQQGPRTDAADSRRGSTPIDSSNHVPARPSPDSDVVTIALPSGGPKLHGGLLSSNLGAGGDVAASKQQQRHQRRGEDEEVEDVRAELVLVHPGCAACLDVVRRKGVGILSSVASSSQ
ncbi:uncharacterized protein PSFLO_01780 [Pseudozyma flocculosa]|uniref:Copper-fist domain-containing protein n=1 Tax=Pseudozyma flocculosa TaxID=84751 RepID=A0A5C3EYU1_9BASI|nr:uncharacterized protein PSFLO_01780 [Pseudozyma flocculosa]